MKKISIITLIIICIMVSCSKHNSYNTIQSIEENNTTVQIPANSTKKENKTKINFDPEKIRATIDEIEKEVKQLEDNYRAEDMSRSIAWQNNNNSEITYYEYPFDYDKFISQWNDLLTKFNDFEKEVITALERSGKDVKKSGYESLVKERLQEVKIRIEQKIKSTTAAKDSFMDRLKTTLYYKFFENMTSEDAEAKVNNIAQQGKDALIEELKRK